MIVVLALCAVILALVDEANARGRSLTGWAVVLLAIAMLIEHGWHV